MVFVPLDQQDVLSLRRCVQAEKIDPSLAKKVTHILFYYIVFVEECQDVRFFFGRIVKYVLPNRT